MIPDFSKAAIYNLPTLIMESVDTICKVKDNPEYMKGGKDEQKKNVTEDNLCQIYAARSKDV